MRKLWRRAYKDCKSGNLPFWFKPYKLHVYHIIPTTSIKKKYIKNTKSQN